MFLLALFALNTNATSIIISNLDGAGEGFNDATGVSPTGGNPGVTLGEQRLRVFEHAAKIWGTVIDSNVTIIVGAQFNPLTCTASQAILGSAGAASSYRNFPNAPITSTWYSVALANSLAGSDLLPGSEIVATFNSEIDNNNNCLNNINWYYGLDSNKPGGTVDLLSVVLHEIGHGLGFQTLVNLANGQKALGFNDAYMLNLEDHSLGRTWGHPATTDAQRLASSIDSADLHWTGTNVTALISNYTAGINQGHVRMYAPNPVEGGSSVSHFDTAIAPNEMMEPSLVGSYSGPGLALPLFEDIGWPVFTDARPLIAVLGDQTSNGQSIQVDILIDDNDTLLASLILNAVSSNLAIVDAGGLSFSGTGNQRTLTVTPLPGSSGTVNIDVTVSDASSNASENFDLTVTLNNPPVISVTSPADGAEFLDTDTVNLIASASDVEDGDISASLAWSSSIDGALGSGPSLSVQLSEGAHTLTVTVVDSLGVSDTVNHTVYSYGVGDSDIDGLNDNWEFISFGSLNETAAGDFDSDGLTNLQEFNQGTIPVNPDTDGDGVTDGDEVNVYGLDPTLSNTGDIGPRSNADGQINTGDMVIMSRLVTGLLAPTTLESILADINNDSQINAADLLLLQQAILNGTAP